MKKMLSAIMALTLALGSLPLAYADAETEHTITEEPMSNQEVIYDLSLADAIEMAFADNERLLANEQKQIAAEISIDSAYLSRKPYKKAVVNVTSNFELYCLKEGYYIKTAQMSQRLAIAEADKIRSSIAYGVTEAYYNLVLMKKLTNAAQNAVSLANTNKAIVDEQYSLGLLSALDYENASLASILAKSNLDSYVMNEAIAEENLKILLNIDDKNIRINPTDEIECEEFVSDSTKDAQLASESRYDLNALKESMDLAYEYFDLSSVLTENSATYNSAYSSYLDAKYNYNYALKMTKLSVQSMYNAILSAKDKMDISEIQYNIKRKEYNAAKLKYELGVIANVELTKAINDLYDAQVSYANAKLTYRMAIEKYKYEITTGL